MLGNRSSAEWVAEYAQSHTHKINRACHTVGIPIVALSVLALVLAPFITGLWKVGVSLFIVGWIIQFVGHYYEGKPPEFLKDWRFLLVGLRWWFMKLAGKA